MNDQPTDIPGLDEVDATIDEMIQASGLRGQRVPIAPSIASTISANTEVAAELNAAQNILDHAVTIPAPTDANVVRAEMLATIANLPQRKQRAPRRKRILRSMSIVLAAIFVLVGSTVATAHTNTGLGKFVRHSVKQYLGVKLTAPANKTTTPHNPPPPAIVETTDTPDPSAESQSPAPDAESENPCDSSSSVSETPPAADTPAANPEETADAQQTKDAPETPTPIAPVQSTTSSGECTSTPSTETPANTGKTEPVEPEAESTPTPPEVDPISGPATPQ